MRSFKNLFNDIEKLKKQERNRNQESEKFIRIPFMFPQIGKSIKGQIVCPLSDSGEEVDVYIMRENHWFGNKLIQANDKNNEILKTIPNLNEYIKATRYNRDIPYVERYKKQKTLYMGMFNPKYKEPVFILSITGEDKILSFLDQLQNIYAEKGDEIFKCVLEVTQQEDYSIMVKVTGEVQMDSSELLENLFPNESKKYRNAVYHKLYDDFVLPEEKIKEIVLKWIGQMKNKYGILNVDKEDSINENFQVGKNLYEDEMTKGSGIDDSLNDDDLDFNFDEIEEESLGDFEGVEMNEENLPDFLKD